VILRLVCRPPNTAFDELVAWLIRHALRHFGRSRWALRRHQAIDAAFHARDRYFADHIFITICVGWARLNQVMVGWTHRWHIAIYDVRCTPLSESELQALSAKYPTKMAIRVITNFILATQAFSMDSRFMRSCTNRSKDIQNIHQNCLGSRHHRKDVASKRVTQLGTERFGGVFRAWSCGLVTQASHLELSLGGTTRRAKR
jgi:hypothetical protein